MLVEPDTAIESDGEDTKPMKKRDQKLASPCKVMVKRMSSGSLKSFHGSGSSKDEYCSELKEEHLEVETDANGNVNTKVSIQSTRKRKSVEKSQMVKEGVPAVQERKPNKRTTEPKGKKGRGRKSQAAALREQTEDIQPKEERPAIPIRLPIATAGTTPIGPPAGAAQQAASLFRTKASVKIYDPTQTSSPNSSEQSNTPQTPDIRTPQTPITPESIQGQPPPSVSSNISESQQVIIQPSPSCSLPSPTTPRTPSTTGKNAWLSNIECCLWMCYPPFPAFDLLQACDSMVE